MTAKSILIIEDEHALGTALSFLVRRMGHLPTLVASGGAGLAALAAGGPSAVVLDIGLPDMSGLQVLEKLRSAGISVPVLVITAHATLDHAILAQKNGAAAYLNKPLDLGEFERALSGLLAPAVDLTTASTARPADRGITLIGASPGLREAFVGIAKACAGDFPVLISGAGGTGKKLAASLIHAHGPGAGGAFEIISCSTADEDSLLASSHSGTLVLDGITELSRPLQQRLASWLGGFQTRGSRIIATSTIPPREAVADGVLREDLYYALATLTIHLPPLRERSGDIPALASFFAGTSGSGEPAVLTSAALSALQGYAWPGNVRELRHVIEYALKTAAGGPVFPSHLPTHVASATDGDQFPNPGELESAVSRWLDHELSHSAENPPDYDSLLDCIERVMLGNLLARHGGKPTHLAAALRMHRATLRQKLRRAGLKRDEE